MPTRKRYALWLVPEEPATEEFGGLIDTLSTRYGGPRFSPHVTLLGWILGEDEALAETTARLAEQLTSLPVRTAGLFGEAYYFRCLYTRLEKSKELLAAHDHASNAFGAGYANDYRPHLSLAYGHLSAEEKTTLRGELNGTVPKEFTVNRLELVRITVTIADWRVVTRCTLNAS